MFVTANYPSAPVIKLAGIIIKHYSYLRNEVFEEKRDIKSFEDISRKEIWREFISSPEYNDFNLNAYLDSVRLLIVTLSMTYGYSLHISMI